jgi:hypothetical protein
MSKEKQEQQHIDEIINELTSLSLRTNTLTHELKRLRQQDRQESPPTSNPKYDHDFNEGDRIVIKNAYLGKKGTEGKVSYVTRTQVTLQDDSGRFHTRKFTNVGKVKEGGS